MIELSLVLVIIGLIVGGILVGRDLISSAAIRGQLTQLEKYQQAVNTFRGKYGYLPGDIPDPDATNFGFGSRGPGRAQGNGDGAIEGAPFLGWGISLLGGETLMFWVDLSKAGLINESFNAVSTCVTNITGASSTALSKYIPEAKIGNGNYLSVWSGGPSATYAGGWLNSDNMNYFALSGITSISAADGVPSALPKLTVSQTYAIDMKIDDGRPMTGRVRPYYTDRITANWIVTWASSAATDSATTCYNSTSLNYSITYNNGSGVNCALSIRFN